MIRYSLAKAQLYRLIDGHAPKWRARSRELTRKSKAAKKFVGPASHWSRVKEVYVKLQNDKCIYCETKLKGSEVALIDYDVEHFRPKNKVKAWVSPVNYGYPTGDVARGYYWLAYEPWNYAVACKPCNTVLKSNYFPVAKKRGASNATLNALRKEEPFLCYPLGDQDADPESLVTFIGTVAVPTAAPDTFEHARGQLIIEFFKLNKLELLHRQRAALLFLVGTALAKLTTHPTRIDFTRLVGRAASGRDAHTSCAKAFIALWKRDKALARKILKRCVTYLASEEGAIPPPGPPL